MPQPSVELFGAQLPPLSNCGRQSRPLTYVPCDEVITPLKPNHFLHPHLDNEEVIGLDIKEVESSTIQLVANWEHITSQLNIFWCIFTSH